MASRRTTATALGRWLWPAYTPTARTMPASGLSPDELDDKDATVKTLTMSEKQVAATITTHCVDRKVNRRRRLTRPP